MGGWGDHFHFVGSGFQGKPQVSLFALINLLNFLHFLSCINVLHDRAGRRVNGRYSEE
jgi:hypothetical protein